MAIGRITGQMLSSTLSRGTTDLTLGTTGQSNLFHVDATNDRIGIGLNNPSVQLQTTGSAIVGTDLTVTGNLTVNGSTTTVNTTNMTVDDKNIELSHSLSGNSPTDAAADGGGIILKGDTDHTILWNNATDDWDFSENIDIAAGKVYKLGGSTILGANTLDLENIQIAGNVITTASNADLSLQPSGTGAVKIEGIRIQGDVITSDDSSVVQFGEGAAVNGNFNVGGSLQLSQSTAVTSILDEDAFGSNSATALATQQSIKAYVDSVSGGSLTLGDSASNAGAVNINGDEQLIFRSGDSITATVAGNGVTFDLNETISVDTITAGDSSAITVGSAMKSTSSFGFDGSVQVTSILDEDAMGSNSATALATQQSIKAYTDSATQTMSNKTLTSPVLNGTISGTGFKDEDGMDSNSATALASQQSIKAYVDAQDAAIASDSLTFTNKTFDADGTGNSITNLAVADFAAAAIVTEAEGISSNDNDNTLPTSAAVKDLVDASKVDNLNKVGGLTPKKNIPENIQEDLEIENNNEEIKKLK